MQRVSVLRTFASWRVSGIRGEYNLGLLSGFRDIEQNASGPKGPSGEAFLLGCFNVNNIHD